MPGIERLGMLGVALRRLTMAPHLAPIGPGPAPVAAQVIGSYGQVNLQEAG